MPGAFDSRLSKSFFSPPFFPPYSKRGHELLRRLVIPFPLSTR